MNINKRLIRYISTLLLTWCFVVPCLADYISDHIDEMKIDDANATIILYMDSEFSTQEFNEKSIKKIYKKARKQLRKELPAQYAYYDLRIMALGMPIENLSDKENAEDNKKKPSHHKHGGWWGDIAYDGAPWVSNISQPHQTTAALKNKHISLWQSHGRYYDKAKGMWKWQRPFFFSTTEDLFTQTIVVPYLIPMLQNAGAYVFTPRERDWQAAEVIVDNDSPTPFFTIGTHSGHWSKANGAGFALPNDTIPDGYNPFEKGTALKVNATHSTDCSYAMYQPQFSKAGRYAVYVSYTTEKNSVSDALYSVFHKGQRTDFRVNQQMGGGTWVYLGTFDFDEGCSTNNCVVLYALSADRGVITTDAIRFGGGMGNISRGGSVSGMPRTLEGARYYAQWAGAPYSIYGGYHGDDDYKDDINTRSLMTNWLSGGSIFNPNKEGLRVPIELALAIHSDAGYDKDMRSVFGSLAICTTGYNDGNLATGISREHSKNLAQSLLDQVRKDIKSKYGEWTWRDLYDRNYSETRLPAMPSVIFETLSHQSFPDMRYAHDPNFKFTLARSIYKTVLRFEAEAHGEKAIVQPLAPEDFSIRLSDDGKAILTWVPQKDDNESTATPTGYNVYMAMGNGGYDNGTHTQHGYYVAPLAPDVLYRFRITATNAGGESFPTEELCVLYHSAVSPTILIVNGFQRLSSPAVHNGIDDKGFDIAEDPGVSYGLTAGWSGQQQVFSTSTAGREGPGAFGYSGQELQGRFIAGNDFCYVAEHAAAIQASGQYNIVSATKSIVEWGAIDLSHFDCIDLILGNERNDHHSLHPYKTFSKHLREQLSSYMRKSKGSITGRHTLLASGSYIASDMQENDDERDFLRDVLHCTYDGYTRDGNAAASGLQLSLLLTNTLNAEHYATTQSDILLPAHAGGPFTAMLYADGQSAAIAEPARLFVMGFPFECITNVTQRATVMAGILNFLLR